MRREDEYITTTRKQLMKDGIYEENSALGWFNFKGRIGCWYQPKDATQELEDMIEYVVSNDDFETAMAFKLALKELNQYFIDKNINPEHF